MILARLWQGVQRRWSLVGGDGSAGFAGLAPWVLPVMIVGYDHADAAALNGLSWAEDAGGSGGLFPTLQLVCGSDIFVHAIGVDNDARVTVHEAESPWLTNATVNDHMRFPPNTRAGGFHSVIGPRGMALAPSAQPYNLPRPLLVTTPLALTIRGQTANGRINATVLYEEAA